MEVVRVSCVWIWIILVLDLLLCIYFFFFFFFSSRRRHTRLTCDWSSDRVLFRSIFEPEPDGKTPVTVRGFDWYDDTSAGEYLVYILLLEQFAADLLANYGHETLPRFLEL